LSGLVFWALTTGTWRLPGGVAQLGEHLLCKQGVVGSSPITSTRDGVEVVGHLETTGWLITEKQEVRCCGYCSGASCFDNCSVNG
jgi:hypothetical protein